MKDRGRRPWWGHLEGRCGAFAPERLIRLRVLRGPVLVVAMALAMTTPGCLTAALWDSGTPRGVEEETLADGSTVEVDAEPARATWERVLLTPVTLVGDLGLAVIGSVAWCFAFGSDDDDDDYGSFDDDDC